ncbi:MAG TPA: hypothetical protein VJK51_04865 [Candidatus Nanoarchaeia archaeon]|nr:hypothetical protein [Candidatus Nanoarchaeia archaeon]
MKRRISLPYYFLDEKNKAPPLVQIAATQPSSSGKKFGDVISYGAAGITLLNGKKLNKNLCFFGITETQFWTNASRQMFKDCILFTLG